MKYSLIDGVKKEAVNSGERGQCVCCGAETVAHCGELNMNHWKHKNLADCDNWSETETEWHRQWKNQFPLAFQEIVMHDDTTGEKHIADIYNPTKKLVIEVQHSPIAVEEIKARELFYKKMMWVVDLIPYLLNITLHEDVEPAFYKTVITPWSKAIEKKSNALEREGKYDEAREVRTANWEDDYAEEFRDKYENHNSKGDYFLLQWKYQHKRWNLSAMPMFFDLGGEHVYMNVETIKIGNGFVVKRFLKSDFINKYNQQ